MAGLVYSREIHKYLRGPSRNIYGTPQGTVQHAEQRKCLRRGEGGGSIHCEFLTLIREAGAGATISYHVIKIHSTLNFRR